MAGAVTAGQIEVSQFKAAVYALLGEAFENVQGIFLDKGASLFETLAGISAAEASIPVGGQCATLAAQVKHVAFYLEVTEHSARSGQNAHYDWGKIWRETGAVTEEEWSAIQAELRQRYDAIRKLVEETPDWSNVYTIGGAIAVVAHTAYHLGEIRQALCVLRRP